MNSSRHVVWLPETAQTGLRPAHRSMPDRRFPGLLAVTDADLRQFHYLNRAGHRWLRLGPRDVLCLWRFADFCPKWFCDIISAEIIPALCRQGYWRGPVVFLNGQAATVALDMRIWRRGSAGEEAQGCLLLGQPHRYQGRPHPVDPAQFPGALRASCLRRNRSARPGWKQGTTSISRTER